MAHIYKHLQSFNSLMDHEKPPKIVVKVAEKGMNTAGSIGSLEKTTMPLWMISEWRAALDFEVELYWLGIGNIKYALSDI